MLNKLCILYQYGFLYITFVYLQTVYAPCELWQSNVTSIYSFVYVWMYYTRACIVCVNKKEILLQTVVTTLDRGYKSRKFGLKPLIWAMINMIRILI